MVRLSKNLTTVILVKLKYKGHDKKSICILKANFDLKKTFIHPILLTSRVK